MENPKPCGKFVRFHGKFKMPGEFLELNGVRNHFSSSYEQWQNGLAEAAIDSIMRLAGTVMAESGLGGEILVQAALAARSNLSWI